MITIKDDSSVLSPQDISILNGKNWNFKVNLLK